ncbi:zinc knuckle CX2CX4HX4C containing protein, partial [Tanacetum coccineum]
MWSTTSSSSVPLSLMDTAYRSLFFVVSCEVQAQIRRIFLDGYDVLDVRTVFFRFLRLSSRMRAFLLIFTNLDAVLEGGPWMIRNSPIILKKWAMNTSLHKEELTCIPIWVKLHDVPIQVFEEDGISLIETYLRKLIMLDSYTSLICKDSWGRSSFARCLIEINLEAEFKESITIGIPDLDGPGETCPKKVVTNPVVNDTNTTNDGLQKVMNIKRNNKGSSACNKLPKGVLVSKGFQARKDFAFKPKASNVGSNGDNGTRQDTGKKTTIIASPNPFAALGVDEVEEEEVENIWDESKNLNL